MGQVLLADEIQGGDVAVQLFLFLKESCYQWALEMLRSKTAKK
jgi:hypothetical protein|tara:strand:- start:346 stop:474 length:129 start_codon:yes stop_codon:yes gene_type:complete